MQGTAYGADRLGQQECENPVCTEDHETVFLRSNCHPNAAMWPLYHAQSVVMVCAACRAPVATLAVADESRTVDIPIEVLDEAGR